MYTIDVRIFGVPSRLDNIRMNQRILGVPDSNIFLDYERSGVVANAKRAWLHPTEASHILVLQDDVVLCDGFMEICQRIVAAHPDKVISLFPFGFLRENSLKFARVEDMVTPYVEARPVSGQGIIMPARYARECMESFPIYAEDDDANISAWAKAKGVDRITTLPATLQHIGDVSAIDDRPMRRTPYFWQQAPQADWSSQLVYKHKDVRGGADDEEFAFKVAMANRTIEVSAVGRRRSVLRQYKDFLTEAEPDLSVRAQRADADGDALQAIENAVRDGLSRQGVTQVQSRAVVIDGRAYLLLGDGKSSYTWLCRKLRPEGLRSSYGNVQFVEKVDGRLVAHSAPYFRKMRWCEIMSVPIDAVILLNKADKAGVRRVEGNGKFKEVVEHMKMPSGSARMIEMLEMAGALASLPVYAVDFALRADEEMLPPRQ